MRRPLNVKQMHFWRKKIVSLVLLVPMLMEPLALLYRKIFTVVPSLLNFECDLMAGILPDKLLLEVVHHHVAVERCFHNVHQLFPVQVGPYGRPFSPACHSHFLSPRLADRSAPRFETFSVIASACAIHFAAFVGKKLLTFHLDKSLQEGRVVVKVGLGYSVVFDGVLECCALWLRRRLYNPLCGVLDL